MSKDKSTPEAMRAAKKLHKHLHDDLQADWCAILVADIIDQETCLPDLLAEHDRLKEKNSKLCIATGNYMMEVNRLQAINDKLLEACKNTVEELDALQGDYQSGRNIDISDVVASMLQLPQVAIAKANNNKGKNKSMNIECPQCSHSSSKPIQDNKDFRRFSKALFDKDGEHIRSEEWIICLNSECGHEDNQLEFGVTKQN